MAAILGRLAEVCAANRLKPPSRATVYATLGRLDGHFYAVSALPPAVAAALHDLRAPSSVPGHQLAFACLNHGSLAAMCFAAGLPWLDLHQASRLRGWRPKSRGLLAAIARARRIA